MSQSFSRKLSRQRPRARGTGKTVDETDDGSGTRRRRVDRSARADATREADSSGRQRRHTRIALDERLADADAEPSLKVPLRIINEPVAYVVVVPDAPGGVLSAHDRDVMGAARLLADACQGATIAVGSIAGHVLAEAGADRHIDWPDSLSPQIYHPEGRVAHLEALEASFRPRHILFCDTLEGQDLALRLAAVLNESPMTHLFRVCADEVARRPADAELEQVAKAGRILTIAAGASEPVSGERFEARRLRLPSSPEVPVRIKDLGLLPVDPYDVALEEAPFVVSGGNGLRDWHTFKKLVERLRAAPAGTRVACDAGYLPRDRQVGTSGRTLTAECYLALGISGAIQHLQGIENCARVVAVNIDPYAPIVRRADLTVIGDANEIAAALITCLREPPQCL